MIATRKGRIPTSLPRKTVWVLPKGYGDNMKEVWKDIVGYEGLYQVSNLGTVKSLPKYCGVRWDNGRILKPFTNKDGYLVITLSLNGKLKHFQVHRLVAEAFIPNPDNLHCINHKDLCVANNSVNNLEWCSWLYNNTYETRAKRAAKKNLKPILQYDLKGNFIKEWEGGSVIQKELGYNPTHIYSCCTGKRKTSMGYVWEFKEVE